MIAGELEIRLFSQIARLAADMDQAKSVVGGAMKNIESSVASAKAALGALGIGFGVGYFVSLIKGTIDAQDHLRDLSKSTNIAVEDLAGLRLLAKQTGTDLDGLAKGINKMSVEMGKSPEAFKALGITAKDSIGQLQQMADIFNSLPDINQRNALAQKVFSKSWAELAPALSEGGAKIREVVEQGKALSGITKESTDQADKFNDQLAVLNVTLGATRNKVVGDLLPGMNEIAAAMREAAKEGGLLLTVWVGLGGAMANLLGMTDAQKIATRLKEISVELDAARKRLQSGTTNPAGSNSSFYSFLIPDIKVGEAALAKLRANVDALEKERARLLPAEKGGSGDKWGMSASDMANSAINARNAARFLKENRDVAEQDSAYRNLLKTLQEKQLLDRERTESAKLLLDLEALSAKQRATITPDQVAELKRLAEKVDLQKREKAALDAYLEGQKQLADIAQEIAVAKAAEDDKRAQAIMSTEAVIAQIKFETTLISLSNVEREKAIALRTMETSGIDKQSEAYEQLGARLKEAIGTREALQEAKNARDKGIAEFNALFSTIESTGKSVFVHVFSDGKSAFEGIGKAIKASVIDLLYQLTAKRWILSIQASIAGSLGAGSAFAGTGGGSGGMGDLSNILSLGNSAFGSNTGLLGGLFSSAGAYAAAVPGLTSFAAGSQAAMLAAQTGVFGAEGLALTASAGGSALAGGAAAGLAAVPVAGWVALAALAAYSLMSKDKGPKTGDIQLIRQSAQNWKDTSATSTGRSFVVGNNNLSGDQTQNEALLHALIPILNDATKYDPKVLEKFVGLTISGSDVNQGIAQLLQAIAPAAEAASKALGDAAKSEQERVDAIDAGIRAIRDSYRREFDELTAMAAKWKAAAESLRTYGASLIGLGSGGISYASAARQFAITAAQARAGDLGAIGNLQGVSETFRNASLAGSSSSLAYARDVARIQAAVNDAAAVADTRESVALQQRDLLTTQVEKLIDLNEGVASLDETMAAVQAEIAELRNTSEATGKSSARVALILEGAANGSLTLSTEAA